MNYYEFPDTMYNPINSYDGKVVYRLAEYKLPKTKKGVLKVNTTQGLCLIELKEVWKAPIYEKVFNFKDNPMRMRQVVLIPISKEKEDKIKERDLIYAVQ